MNTLKKFITKMTALSLAALMAASMITGVAAKSYDDVKADSEYHEQIDLLSDIGVIVGTSEKEFSPDKSVTREQMAMLMFRLMLGKSDAGKINTTAFEDLYDETYNGAVSWANASGYIIGTSATTFEPVGGITLQDAMTMIVRALGHSNANMDKGYPWTYIDVAIKLDLDRDLEKIDYKSTLTRAQTAVLLYNALTAEYLVGKTTSNGSTVITSTTIIEYVFGYEIDSGIVSATNNYAIGTSSNVIKNNYITITLENGKTMTVNFAETGLTGSPDEWLGQNITVIYSFDSKTKLVKILGTSYKGITEKLDTMSISDDSKYITLGKNNYNVVEKYSDSLATNANELIAYVYDNDGTLTQLKTNAEFKNIFGFGNISLIDDNCDGIGERAIIKNYTFGKLAIDTDGKINIAANLTSDKLTGGFENEVKAQSGDYVLYYFNKGNARLEIKEVLRTTDAVLITKLTDSSITTSEGITYNLGNAASGVLAADLKAVLTVGKYTNLIIKNDTVLAAPSSVSVQSESTYLVAVSNSLPVYTNGSLRYIATVSIGGKTTDIVTNNSNVVAGNVYRYTVDGNSVYTLADSGSAAFVQPGEFSNIHTANADIDISRGAGAYYTLNGVKFVTDSKTAIVAKNGANYEFKSGIYNAGIKIKANAKVTAVFENSIGDVETLRYLYVDNGSLDMVESTTQYVKVLKGAGSQYENGIVYNIYEVFNFTTGKRETRLSVNTLAIGSSYALDSNGNIAVVTAGVINGIISGYTSATITVNGTVYKLASDAVITRINSDLSLTSVKVSEAVYHEVQFVLSNGEIKAAIVKDALSFTASYNKDTKKVVIVPTVENSGIANAQVALTKVLRGNEELKVTDWNLTVNSDNTLTIELFSVTAGTYTFSFNVNGQAHSVSVVLPDITSEAGFNTEADAE